MSNLRHTNISGLEDLAAGFTCVAVVNPMEIVNWGRIISFGRAFINSEVIFSRNGLTNDLHLGWWNGGASQPPLVTTGNRMPLNREVLVVGMYDPAEGKSKLFIDGERVAEMATAPPAPDTERKIVSFGGHSGNGEQWVGTITMPAIFLRALTDAEVMELARKSTLQPVTLSGRVPLTPSAIGGVASVIGTASVGGGKVFQAEVGPDGSWEAVAQDVAVDLSYVGKLAAGHGYLAGGFPDAITRVEGVPASAEVRVIYRGERGQLGDGHLVAEQVSGPDGAWLIEGLNPDLKYDVICRHEGYNDMILSNVSPALATGLEFAGSFTTLDDQVEILLGVGPYQVDVVGGTPPLGVTFGVVGNFVVAAGNPSNFGQFTFTLRVIDSNGLSGTFDSVLEVVEPLPVIIGEPFGGGFYAGDIESDGQWYKLIVADVSADITGTNSRWKTTNTSTAGTDHLTDGVANTSAMIAAGIELHPAAAHYIDHRGGGNADWYMPAKDELNVIYQNLGYSRPNCPPDFQAGGPQAFSNAYYWASTQYSSNHGWIQHFSNGGQASSNKISATPRVRPVRRIPFTPETGG